MTYTIFFEKVREESFPEGYYYAHIPALDLTTHGLGIEGAKAAAADLIKLWIAEKKANGEKIKNEENSFSSVLEIDDAILSE
jgi:predicted RNase H-like HicB family nuclease